MDSREIKSIIEALLFTWGDPLEAKDIASILELNKEEVSNIMDEMIDEFDYNMRGVKIIKIKDSYQLGTRPEHFSWIKKLSNPKTVKGLSNAALETLSIIAYRQPIIKSDIEAIRGVRCDKAVETLMDRELIKEIGRLERVGRPILYGTTDDFLRAFGLETLENLPPLNELMDNLDNIEEEE
ncbi:SMC-Scp complex subunit ScpB [Tissierella sp. MB52-C2]|uniref:SMC-Scp complex subunit ScpB n=1 Tax=Tissierella sp. MB52-C2 TaxID=3070999 RepID=UPI00280BEFF9|nr:SMC-Scp complex subunit ScpB [Tissierella sp. MB52-C2]WMM26487.1 SMC-Scp complex subunit ScpB [Tissierella sp. MB52-C2]